MRDSRCADGAGQPTLPPALSGLMSPRAYPHPVGAVQLISTPISWVLLAGRFAYKIKRPVRYPFVDLRSIERRKFLCAEEVRLNQRFAPQLYLQVCAIVRVNGQPRIVLHGSHRGGGLVGALEHAVRMHRFSSGDELDQLLTTEGIEPRELERFGRGLADVHGTLPVAPPESPWGIPGNVRAQLLRNHHECAEAAAELGTADEVRAQRLALEGRIASALAYMDERRRNGRVRECHGDLHSRNIVRLGERLVAFDCLEYEPQFRWIDVADEIAFLASDLAARNCGSHAHAFLGGYLMRSGDYPACRLIHLYEAHRAYVRAKVAALQAVGLPDGAERESLRREHLRLVTHAAGALTPRHPFLLLTCGLSGSGKSWLAGQLAEPLAALHLRSDVERKRRAGIDAGAHSGSALAEGLYSSEMSAAVYDDLARAATDGLAGGYTVIVDATFLRRAQRARFAELAAALGSSTGVICCQAPLSVLRERVQARRRTALDPSEADLSVLQWQRGRIEPFGAEDPFDVTYVETADPHALEQVLQWIRRRPGKSFPAV